MSITNEQVVELIENAEEIDCALDAILFPNGRDAQLPGSLFERGDGRVHVGITSRLSRYAVAGLG